VSTNRNHSYLSFQRISEHISHPTLHTPHHTQHTTHHKPPPTPHTSPYTTHPTLHTPHHTPHHRFTESDVAYLRSIMFHCEEGYFQWLLSLNTDKVTVHAMTEGSVSAPLYHMRSAICDIPSVMCDMRYAICDMRYANYWCQCNSGQLLVCVPVSLHPCMLLSFLTGLHIPDILYTYAYLHVALSNLSLYA
jgi:hypothetical protein